MKKKKLFTTLCLSATMCLSTLTVQATGQKNEKEGNYNPHSYLMTASKLPARINTNTDIGQMTLMELRILRNYPYAIKGMWFTEADLNGFFLNKCDWYMDRCQKYYEKHARVLTDYSKAKLAPQEDAFVKRIDARIAQLKGKQNIEREGQQLSNPIMAVNTFQLEEIDQQLMSMLAQNNFAIVPTGNEQLFNIYEENDYSQMPSYITTDLFLQAYHMYFGYVLKSLEKYMFSPRINALNQAMYKEAMQIAATAKETEIKDLAEFNAAYFAVADHLLTGSNLVIPASYKKDAEKEIANIMAEKQGFSPMMAKNIDFNYDLFKPRGHYTRSEAQKRYFRAMMWLQTFTFCSEKVDAVKQAAMMGYLLNHIAPKVRNEGIGVYKTLDFLMGEPDNVSVIEMADVLSKNNVTLDNLTNSQTLNLLNEQLNSLFLTRNRITNKLGEAGCDNKVNFMPQRYMPDSYVLSRTFDEKANSEVPFPRGLHIFSAFGVETADKVNDETYHDAANWNQYAKEMGAMKKEMATFEDWDKSMYNKWFEALIQLQQADKSYPGYMKTTAWARKNLNSALASWAELRHDAILYAEQPVVAECGGGEDFPEPIVVGYVEPNLRFWQKMKEMISLTRSLLSGSGLLTDDLANKTTSLDDYMDFCINVSKKELANQKLTQEEYSTIQKMGSSIEWYTLGVLDPDIMNKEGKNNSEDEDLYDSPESWEFVTGADRSIAVCADVFTRNVLGCTKCGILTEATGTADAMYVVVPINGNIYLTRGAVFSYYEFINPLDTRYTDEEWQKRIEDGKTPARPAWMLPFILGKEPKINEQITYSAGC